ISLSGKYAYVAARSARLTVVDVSDPTNPAIVGSIYDATKLKDARAVYVSGNYAYVAANDNDYLTIVDISDPANPAVAGSVQDPQGDGAESIYVSGRYAFVKGASRIIIVDVSNPSSLSSDDIVNSLSGIGYATVYVAGKYLYDVCWGGTFNVVDVSDPSNPTLVASVSDSDNLSGGWALTVAGKYAYACAFYKGLAIIDISGIDTPTLTTGNLDTGTLKVVDNADIANQLYVRGGLTVGPGGILSQGHVGIYASSTAASTALTVHQNATGDILNLFASSTEVFTVLANGNVGIGTTTPASLLEVYSSTTDSKLTITSATGTDPQIVFRTGATPTTRALIGIDYSDANKLKLVRGSDISTSTGITVDSSGNVGIGTTSPASTLQISGSLGLNYISKSSDYTATADDNVIAVDASSATTTISLPSAAGITGRLYTIKKIDDSVNDVVVDPDSAETIDGSATYSLSSQWKYVTIISDGSNWLVIGNN
ncbi:MAG: LVIVD repeat-containing protein, partial [Candidatus Thorarchaeota archaeon]